MNDNFEAVLCLIVSGARVDIKNSNDKTALDLAHTDDIRRILMSQDLLTWSVHEMSENRWAS